MQYTEIKSAALGYADRKDAETIDMMDTFLRIVEARINRKLNTQKMTARATLNTVVDQEYYGLPNDFTGLRDIQLNSDDKVSTMAYLNPEQMNDMSGYTTPHSIYYTIINQQLQIYPTQENSEIEIVYYQNVPQLDDSNTTNWLSEFNPDCYIFGLLVEISSFVKDAQSMMAWEQRFISSVNDIELEDDASRWSGSMLLIRNDR